MTNPILTLIRQRIGPVWSGVIGFIGTLGYTTADLNDFVVRIFDQANVDGSNIVVATVAGIIAYLVGKPQTEVEVVREVDTSPYKPPKPELDESVLFDDYGPQAPVQPVKTAPIDIQRLRTEIKADEGFRDHVYLDTTGHKTVGYGHLLTPDEPEYMQDVGTTVSMTRIDDWFNADISEAIRDARSVVQDFDRHPQSVKHALVNMAFNLGRNRLAGFKNTLALIDAGRYSEAASEALNSRWADQVGKRALRVTAMISSGEPEVRLA